VIKKSIDKKDVLSPFVRIKQSHFHLLNHCRTTIVIFGKMTFGKAVAGLLPNPPVTDLLGG